ncbi:SDR family oxidoreductase [bacterium]|nr:MAG: SDR family oxidoreductase [bacterium]
MPESSTPSRTVPVSSLTGVAIVTGGDSGIGRATVLAFAADGVKVGFLYHSDDAGAAETVKLVEDAGGAVVSVKGDVGDEADVERLFATAEEKFGPVNILVNNAGIDGSGTPVAEMELKTWERSIRTNLTGPFLCCRRFIRGFQPGDRRGKIVNVTSVHEEIQRAGSAEYGASKGGLRNLTRTLSLELGRKGISVTNVGPGMILTPMNQDAIDDPKILAENASHIPMDRAGTSDEVAGLIRFLASPAGDYCTGSSYFIDGGLMMNVGQGA